MKRNLLFLLLLLVSNSFAQNAIKGKIIDEKTKQGIPGASVYINNSSIGTTTDQNGQFYFSTSFNGKIQLVVSYIMYEKKVFVVESSQANHLFIALKEQNNNLKAIEIKGKKRSKANLKKWQELFTENLMGKYNKVNYSNSIKNPEVLLFDFDDKKSVLEVFAKGPIVIENKRLGYEMKVDLEQFNYNMATNEVLYKYSVFYKDMNFPGYKLDEIKRLRRAYYYGSTTHLMRSIFANKVEIEGFKLYYYTSIKNMERVRVVNEITKAAIEAYATKTSPKVELDSLFKNKSVVYGKLPNPLNPSTATDSGNDTLTYYKSVLNLDENICIDTLPAALSRLATPNTTLGTVEFYLSDTLMVRYRGTLAQLNKSLPIEKIPDSATYRSNQLRYNANTLMYFFTNQPLNIQSNGYYAEQSLFIYGDMERRRLGGAVPIDFDPDLP